MPWFDCTASLVDLHSSALRRNSALSVPVGGHRCTVILTNRKQGNVYFPRQRIIQIHWTRKTRVLESRQCPCRSIKSPCTRVNIIIRKHWYLARWCLWFWWWIRSTLQLYSQLEGWIFVMLCLFSFLALSFFFMALSKIWISTMTHVCQPP